MDISRPTPNPTHPLQTQRPPATCLTHSVRRPTPTPPPARVLCAVCAEPVRSAVSPPAPPRHPGLSPREIEVLVHWLKHGSKPATGKALHITESTVGTHLQRVRQKYADAGRPARTKMALAIRAIQDGLVDVDDF